MKIKLAPLQLQKPILAPSMQQSITVLMLPIADLNMAIDQELQSNPLLELDEDSPEFLLQKGDMEMRKHLERHFEAADSPTYESFDEEDLPEERQLSKEMSLEDCLLEQLRMEISDPLHLKIGELIIGNINEDGYFTATCGEIAQLAGIEDVSLVDHVLSIIQNFEPLGIASRDLKECLVTQLKAQYNGHSALPISIVTGHLEELGKKKYLDIARALGKPPEDIKNAAQMIATLEPKPARSYRPLSDNTYIRPDVVIHLDPLQGYQVTVNHTGIPLIRINPMYRNMLNQKNLNEEERNFVREKLKNALLFIKSVEQRGNTIREIANFILNKQKEFFEGNHLSIVPLTLKDVAEAINRNESTVSRAIQNKYVDTPQGMFPLRFFFSQAVNDSGPGNVSSRSIKEEIKDMVDAEDKAAPLSDQDIQNHFTGKGMNVARRTISKYRQALHIAPSHLRKE